MLCTQKLKPNENGVFEIKFDSFDGCPASSSYIRDLEQLLKDLAKIDMNACGVKNIKIKSFDLPMSDKAGLILDNGKVKVLEKTNKQVLDEVVGYMLENYKNLKNVGVEITGKNNELLFERKA